MSSAVFTLRTTSGVADETTSNDEASSQCMTSFSLHDAASHAYWEDRLRKENLAVLMHRGAPHGHDQREMHSFLAADYELGPLARGNRTMHRTKSRASLAGQDYAQGKNPVTGYDTRYRLDRNLPFFTPRSAEARRPAASETTNAFPAEPRMLCARGDALKPHAVPRVCRRRDRPAWPASVGRGALEAACSISLRREMLRPQTALPHETDMHSSAECKAQVSSSPGLAQFDRDPAARRKEGLCCEPASSPSPSTPTLCPQ